MVVVAGNFCGCCVLYTGQKLCVSHAQVSDVLSPYISVYVHFSIMCLYRMCCSRGTLVFKGGERTVLKRELRACPSSVFLPFFAFFVDTLV